jgi:hypothetical protein
MRVIRVVSAALLGVTACMFTASVGQAAADDGTSFGFGVRPTTAKPGSRITLDAQDCPQAVRISSGLFDTVTIPKGRRSATATIDWDARAGAMYQLTFQCGAETGLTDLAVGATGASKPAAAHSATRPVKKQDADEPGTYRLDGGQQDERQDRQRDERQDERQDSQLRGQQNRQDGQHREDRGQDHGEDHGRDHGDDHGSHDEHALGVRSGDPWSPEHGVHAGAGGTLDGFDGQKLGIGAALVVGTFAAAYHLAHRRPEEEPDA